MDTRDRSEPGCDLQQPAWRAGKSTENPKTGARGERQFVGILILLTVCGLLWRGLLSYYLVPAWESAQNVAQFPDDYPALARSLIETHTLGYGPDGGASPTTVRGPGFPLWLALGMLTGGFDSRWLGLWSSLPMLFLAPFAAVAAARRYGAIPAVTVALILLFHPLPSLLSSRVMSDEFFAVCGFAAILVWDSALRTTRARHALLLAITTAGLLAFQILTRSTGLLFLLIVVILGFWPRRQRRGLTVLVVVVALLPPLLWSYRSSQLEGRFVFVHSLMAYNFWIGEGFDRYGYGWTDPDTWPRVVESLGAVGDLSPERLHNFYYPDLTPTETATLETKLQRAAVNRIVADPFGYARRVVRGVYRFWIQAQSTQTTTWHTFTVLPLLCLALFAVLRMFSGTLPQERIIVAAILVIGLHNICYAGVLPMARFSVQVYPELAWLVGCSLSRRPAR